MTSHAATLQHRAEFKFGDDLFNRCLAGSALVGAIVLAVILLAPIPKAVMNAVTAEPARVARLVLDEPVVPTKVVAPVTHPEAKPGLEGPGGPVAGTPGTGALGKTPPHPAPNADAGPNPVPTKGGGGDGIAPGLGSGGGNGTGDLGRARAQQLVAANLAGTSSSLERSLSGLSNALASTSTGSAPPVGVGGRRRAVGGARSDAELGAVNAGISGGGGRADLAGSAVTGSYVAIGSLTGTGGGSGGGVGNGPGSGGYGGGGGLGGGSGGGVGGGIGGGAGDGVAGGGAGGGGGGGDGGGGNGGSGWGGTPGAGGRGAAPPGVYRSNASLMAVIQKYQAGIQYCYGNELKKHEGLRGKLVVALTVDAAGHVIDCSVVQNTLGAPAMSSCALSQIRDWKFPPIPVGVTAFQVPFVFTPPN